MNTLRIFKKTIDQNGNKAVAMSVLFFIVSLFLALSLPAHAGNTGPDFAFPKTVEANAERELHTALSQRNSAGALKALVNLTVARDLISGENVTAQLGMIDSVARLLPSPYNSVGYLLEAELYKNIYLQDRYKYDRRTVASLAESSDGNSPFIWDAERFKTRIDSLASLSLAYSDDAEKIPLSRLDSLITIEGGSDLFKFKPEDFTLYDFIIYKVVSLNELFPRPKTIPFYEAQQDGRLNNISLIDKLISACPKDNIARSFALIRKSNLLNETERKEFLMAEIKTLDAVPEAVPLICEYYTDFIIGDLMDTSDKKQEEIKAFYNLVNSVCMKIKHSDSTKLLKEIAEAITNPAVSVGLPSCVSTDTNFYITYTASNIPEFQILIYRCDGFNDGRISINKISKTLKKVAAIPVKLSADIPFSLSDSIPYSIAFPGRYCLFVSRSSSPEGIISPSGYADVNAFNVSDIDIITLCDYKDEEAGIFVVKSKDGQPIENASVRFEKRSYPQGKDKVRTVATDSRGYARSPYSQSSAEATYKGSKASTYLYTYNNRPAGKPQMLLLTDLAVYKPGETVRFSGILYENSSDKRKTLPGKDIRIILRDANYQPVDSLSLVTDFAGMISGEFKLPKSGLLGSWNLSTDTREVELSGVSFEVADYKAPTLQLTLERKEAAPDTLRFEGTAMTYSGMPVADRPINYTIEYTPFNGWWHRSSPAESYASETKSDANGYYQITLPLNNLDLSEYKGVFNMTATITDSSGETVSSNKLYFTLRDLWRLEPDIAPYIEVNGDSIMLSVSVKDYLNMPVARNCRYEIYNEKNELAGSGEFMSPIMKLPSARYPSGRYVLRFRPEGDSSDWTEASTIFYWNNDTIPPVETPLWVPEEKYIVNPNETPLWVPEEKYIVNPNDSEVTLCYGSSYEGQNILCVIQDTDGRHTTRWLVSDGKNQSLRIPAPSDGKKVVTFIACREHEYYSRSVEIWPLVETQKLEIAVESFRDKIVPGEQEKWRIKLTKGDRPAEGNLVAVMYDKALEAIAPLQWSDSGLRRNYPNFINISGERVFDRRLSFITRYPNYPFVPSPYMNFQTYGYPLYGGKGIQELYVGRTRMQGSAGGITNAKMAMATAKDDMVEMAVAEEAEAGIADADAGIIPDAEQLRQAEMPLAFFIPEMATDANGNASLDFTVPDFNTTWNLKLLAFTPNLDASVTTLQTIASKKVMVKLNAPRFLRTGDRILLTLRMYNNTTDSLNLSGSIEVFNPLTGEILLRHSSAEIRTRPSGNQLVEVEFVCPQYIDMISIRGFASAGSDSDGEQTIIPVMPSSTPVIESVSIYTSPEANEFSTVLPEFAQDSKITLSLCTNPIWEVLTSMASLIDNDSQSVLRLLDSFYANSVSTGLLRKHSDLKEALADILKRAEAEGGLKSKLETDEELKIVALSNTPWVNDATETNLRLSRLADLMDEGMAKETLEANWVKILSLRNDDGGFSWLPGMKSSLWITSSLISKLGMLKHSHYLPQMTDYDKTIEKAVRFCDAKIIEDYKTQDSKHYNYAGLASYLFARSFYDTFTPSAAFRNLKERALDSIASGWKYGDISEKATVAILLNRSGRNMVAREILESLRQYASTNPIKGVWFDNLESYGKGMDKLAVTSRVLMAFREISPDDRLIQGMLQWLLLQKETQEWGSSTGAIDAIDAVLTSDLPTIPTDTLPAISVNGREINCEGMANAMGWIKMNFNPKEISEKELRIRGTGRIMWGGLVSQFVAPLSTVEPHPCDNLRINKQLLLISGNEGSTEVVETNSFKPGDRIRVTFIIENDKDMDYVVVNYGLSSCFTPVSQLSEYTFSDGLGYYREIKNSELNLYFEFLPRGHHIVTFDCFATQSGEFSSGMAQAQSLYAPVNAAHSGAGKIEVCILKK